MGKHAGTIRAGGLAAFAVAAVFALVIALGVGGPAQAYAAQKGNLAAGSTAVSAQATPKLDTDINLWAGNTAETDVTLSYYTYAMSDAKVTKVTSNNSSVLKVKKINNDQDVWSYEVYPIKPGKAKLSVTYKLGNKTKTISGVYAVKTCPDAITSITFNGQAQAVPTSKAGITGSTYYGFTGTKAVLNVQVADGWEIEYMNGYFYGPSNKSKDVKVRNGKAFTIPKGYSGNINFDVASENDGRSFSYTLYINRDKPLELSSSNYYIGHPASQAPNYQTIYAAGEKAKIVSFTSSNPKVLKATAAKNYKALRIQPKKAGTAKLTLKYIANGKTYTHTAKCTVNQYPIKAVALNGKSLSLKQHAYGYFDYSYKSSKSKAQVKFAAANGWKLKSIKVYGGNSNGKTLKNGGSFSLPKKEFTSAQATFTKGKAKFTYWIELRRI